MWTSAAPLEITPGDRRVLESWVRAYQTPQSIALRTQIVLAAAQGHPNNRIARELGVTRTTILLWRRRFSSGGPEALTEVAPGRGRKRSIPPEKIAEILQLTVSSQPQGATQWTCRRMAQATGVSPDTVNRIWRDHGLQPHRIKTFKLSADPRFIEKLTDVVGVYLNPPDKAVVLCVDEKSQIQALDRTQPGLPLKPGRCQTMTHDYKRHGTTTLFAALNVLEGTVVGQCVPHHRHQEFLGFLRKLEREFPAPIDLHLILDNYATHKHPAVKTWLAAHPRFQLHFTPTSSSWLNLVECWFSALTKRRIRRGSFVSVPNLIEAIHEYIDLNNSDPRPFVWTASAQSILDKLNHCRVISQTDH